MPKLPHPTGREMLRFLQRQGYVLSHVRGSHHYYANGKMKLGVPVHSGKTLRVGTLHSLIRAMGLTVEEFVRLWNE